MDRALLIVVGTVAVASLLFMAPASVMAKKGGGYYYKSAATGRFTSKASYKSSPATTYRSRR